MILIPGELKSDIQFSNLNYTTNELTICTNDGKKVVKKVKLPDEGPWRTMRIFNNLYFIKKEFKKDIYTTSLAKYDVATNRLGEVRVIEVPSKSDPTFYNPYTLYSRNGKYIALRVRPGKLHTTETSSRFVTTGFVVTVLDADLNIHYSTTIPFEYDEKNLSMM